MNELNNPDVFVPLIISNIVALIILFSCLKYQRLGRLLMLLLFVWAGCTNWYWATNEPHVYVDYANYAFLPFYKSFIKGWFSDHVLWMVGPIAVAQLLIGISMLFKGWIFKLGVIGGMIFLIAIIPLGIGSGFPFPIITAFAFYLLYRQPFVNYLWKPTILNKAELS